MVKQFQEKKSNRNQKIGDTKRSKNNFYDQQFWDTVKDIQKVAAEGFTYKEKKKQQIQKLYQLGAPKPKQQKMPYYLLKNLRQKQKEREVQHREEQRQAGMLVLEKKKKKRRRDK